MHRETNVGRLTRPRFRRDNLIEIVSLQILPVEIHTECLLASSRYGVARDVECKLMIDKLSIQYFRKNRATLLLLGLLIFSCGAYGDGRAAGSQPPTSGAEILSADGQAYLRSQIESGHFTELQRPNFGKYRADVATFYHSYSYELPWINEMQPTPQARAAITLLQHADNKGLSAKDYDGMRWTERVNKLEPYNPHPAESDAVKFDLTLTVSLMRYISDLHIGRIDPHVFGIEANISQRKYDLAQFLEWNVVHSRDVASSLGKVEPQYPGYRRTIEALQTYRQLAAVRDMGQPFPAVKKAVRPGQTYVGVQQLARFLHLVGDLPEDTQISAGGTVYQGALVDAVKRFQERHGLEPDGIIGPRTLAELNVPLARRVRQIQLTLERWRWMPTEYSEAPIVVNIPEFRLRAYDRSFHVAVTMKVVLGKTYDHKTPIFMSDLKSVIFRPYWDVPISIVREEIVPSLERDPDYLDKQDMELLDANRNVIANQKVTPATLEELRAGTLSVRQQPGPNNALGLIKFDFPNEYGVYMHDTPAKLLFSRSKRDFSHGCIRLENPVALAAWVLQNNPGWNDQRIHAAMKGEDAQAVALARPIPVLIVYGTVVVLKDGLIRFYDDLYGQDAELDRALRTYSRQQGSLRLPRLISK
jgi:murein L,D-transpeptidase YcbB/YkuD